MAILGQGDSRIMVRIRKMPNDGSRGALYDEYALLDKNNESAITRYIVPEEGAYSVDVTLLRGYVSGAYDGGIGIKIRDKATGALEKSELIQVCRLHDVEVEGKRMKDVKMHFQSLTPDEELSDETNIMGCDPLGLAGIEVTICRYSKLETKSLSDEELEKQKAAYSAKLLSSGAPTRMPTAVDYITFKKHGVQYGTDLVGGATIHGRPAPPARQIQLPRLEETRRYHFYCRTAIFLKRQGMILTKIPAKKTSTSSLAIRLKGPSSMTNPISLDSDTEDAVKVGARGRKRSAPAPTADATAPSVKRESSINHSVSDIYNASPRGGSPDTLNGGLRESPLKKVKLENDEMAKLVAENATMQRKINENNAKLASLASSNYKSPTIEDAERDSIGDACFSGRS
ncbi:hypothetical protein BDZ45DRAFT_731926 [Acephala macrosclerotiorum]|nr:hypothetical protein BDZ45DRAFT_731926 [Acephala macrosclerotiorum]